MIEVRRDGIHLDGKVVPLYSGSMHYWRVERKYWQPILAKAKEAGFRTICTYTPWSVHELSNGKFDFGEKDERKDVGAFIQNCKDAGLYVLLRPGPHINAELTFFGVSGKSALGP